MSKKKKPQNEQPNNDPFARIFADYDKQQKLKRDAALEEAKIYLENFYVEDTGTANEFANNPTPPLDSYAPQKTERIVNKRAPEDINTKTISQNTTRKYVEDVQFGASSIIGKREYQQDSLAMFNVPEEKRAIAVLCDGMGGMQGGEKASALCVEMMLSAFEKGYQHIPAFFRENLRDIDDAVSCICDENGNELGAGSTIISVIIDNGNLYWASVGDSHIYIIRGEEMIRVNAEHNLMMMLKEKVKRGEISEKEANEHPNREALISYMGMGGLTLVDVNEKPVGLVEGDTVVLCSDGLYRTVSDSEIYSIVRGNSISPQLAADDLTNLVVERNRPHQDNTTVIIVKYK